MNQVMAATVLAKPGPELKDPELRASTYIPLQHTGRKGSLFTQTPCSSLRRGRRLAMPSVMMQWPVVAQPKPLARLRHVQQGSRRAAGTMLISVYRMPAAATQLKSKLQESILEAVVYSMTRSALAAALPAEMASSRTLPRLAMTSVMMQRPAVAQPRPPAPCLEAVAAVVLRRLHSQAMGAETGGG